jgi:hypothetical protein
MVKMCEENRGKRKEDTTAGPVGFVRAPALHTFYAKVYHIYGQKKAFYEYECLNQNVFPSISAAFRDNGFPAVDAEKALRLINDHWKFTRKVNAVQGSCFFHTGHFTFGRWIS